MTSHSPRLCATITADSTAELRARAAACDADLVELRLDGVARPDVKEAISGLTLPVIVTCRPPSEGGQFAGSESDRHRLLEQAVRSEAAFVDIEWTSGFDDLVAIRQGRGIVLSYHDFTGVPADLESRVAAMAGGPAEVIKVAVTVRRLAECVALRDLARRFGDRHLLVIGMGEAGLITRVCAAWFGAPWAYAGDLAGPGQLSLSRMRQEFRFGSIGAETTLYGLFGRPVSHSLSPAMHNAALGELGLDAVYLPLAGADADDCLQFADAFQMAGASVTSPFKAAIMERLASWDDDAEQAGAVNTIRREGRGWTGTNTDGAGFLAALRGTALAGMRVAILGAGGAARAAARALAAEGARVTLYGRNLRRTREAAARVGVGAAERPVPRGSWDLLVNATPVGTHPDAGVSAFPEGAFDGAVVYDLVYNPARTRLLRDAETQGCHGIGGIEMLVEQARLQLSWWTGRTASAGRMRDAAERRLSAQMS
ncbi:MAG: type I 3-dehydroquinate dehydratase [Acidobacteriota bacterium]